MDAIASSQASIRRSVNEGFARREAARIPFEDASAPAIRNYMRMQESRETSNILSGPVRPIAPDKGASSDNSDESEESGDGILLLITHHESLLTS